MAVPPSPCVVPGRRYGKLATTWVAFSSSARLSCDLRTSISGGQLLAAARAPAGGGDHSIVAR
jgi:hypothetical protein